MKKSITLLALILSVSTAIFASPVKNATANDDIIINSLQKELTISVSVKHENAGKSLVTVYNDANTVLFKDKLANKGAASKAYLLNELENGNYTIEVSAGAQTVTKQIHVYDENGKKTYFFLQ